MGTDWKAAILAAVEPNKIKGGGIHFDQDIQIESECNFGVSGHVTYCPWHLFGNGETKIVFANGAGRLNVGGAGALKATFEKLNLIGNIVSGTGDAGYVSTSTNAILGGTELTVIKECTFAGIHATQAVVDGGIGRLIIRNSSFSGCGAGTAVVNALNSKDLDLDNVQFFDYQNYRGGYYNKQGYPLQWIKAVFSSDPVSSDLGRVRLHNVRTDEGTNFCYIEDYPRVEIVDCSSNTAGNFGIGIHLKGVTKADIKNYWIGYNPNITAAIKLENCGDVVIDNLQTHNGVKPIVVDALTRLTVINSPDAVVQAAAGANYSLNGVKYKGSIIQVGR